MTVILVHVSTEEPVQMMSTPTHVAVWQDTLVKTVKIFVLIYRTITLHK